MHAVRGTPRFERAVHAVAELFERLKITAMFVGGVARTAWLGDGPGEGPIDVIAVMSPEQKNQVAMMASNRGFRVDRAELEATEELDLVPVTHLDAEGETRVHVLVASNALYGRMVAAAATATIGDRSLRIPQAEDFALLLTMAEEHEAVRRLAAAEGFDRQAFHARLVSIGLGGMVTRT